MLQELSYSRPFPLPVIVLELCKRISYKADKPMILGLLSSSWWNHQRSPWVLKSSRLHLIACEFYSNYIVRWQYVLLLLSLFLLNLIFSFPVTTVLYHIFTTLAWVIKLHMFIENWGGKTNNYWELYLSWVLCRHASNVI